MAEDKGVESKGSEEEGGEKEPAGPIIPGTTYKTPEEAAKGFYELKALLDRQGNELGELKKKAQKTETPVDEIGDVSKKISALEKQREELDIDDPEYTQQENKIFRQIRQLESEKIQKQTAAEMSKKFQAILQERDQKQAEQHWLENNPDFQAPEMQMAIKDKMSQDKTGLMDEFLAYKEIKVDQLKQQLDQFSTENTSLKERLNLKAGETEAGGVKIKPTGAMSKPNKDLTAEAIDEGMRSAFRAAK